MELSYSFRLYDFNVYNEKPVTEDENENTGGGYKVNKDDSIFFIQIFGINELGKTCSIIATDFCPFFYIKVGDNWTESTKQRFLNHIKGKIGKYYEDSICSCTLVEQKKLYGFDGGKLHKFVKLDFINTQSLNKVKIYGIIMNQLLKHIN